MLEVCRFLTTNLHIEGCFPREGNGQQQLQMKGGVLRVFTVDRVFS